MGRKASPRVWRDWYVTETGGKMHKLCLVSEGMKKAKDKLEELLEKLADEKKETKRLGLVETDSPYTVAQLAAEFLQLKENTKKDNTVEFHQKNLKRLVEWYGGVEARKLRLLDGQQYLGRLRSENLANTTINHHIRSAKAVLNYAVDNDVIAKNPWKKLDLLPERKRKRIVTDEEFQKLLDACDKSIAYRGVISKEENAKLMRDILCILRYTGLRPGELRKLRWDHLRLDEGLIIIPAEEQKTGTTAKNPEDRVIPLLEESITIFEARKQTHGEHTLVFPNIIGGQWSDVQFSRRFGFLRERAELDTPDHNGEMIVPYSLRHSRLTEAGTTEGWSLFGLMGLSGHTTPQMTKRYVHLNAKHLIREAIEGQKKRLEQEKKEENG